MSSDDIDQFNDFVDSDDLIRMTCKQISQLKPPI